VAWMNWSRDNSRRLMLSHGVEPALEEDTFVRPLLHRPARFRRRPRKEELRQQADAALIAWRQRQQP
jgi:hypothetical protein